MRELTSHSVFVSGYQEKMENNDLISYTASAGGKKRSKGLFSFLCYKEDVYLNQWRKMQLLSFFLFFLKNLCCEKNILKTNRKVPITEWLGHRRQFQCTKKQTNRRICCDDELCFNLIGLFNMQINGKILFLLRVWQDVSVKLAFETVDLLNISHQFWQVLPSPLKVEGKYQRSDLFSY